VPQPQVGSRCGVSCAARQADPESRLLRPLQIDGYPVKLSRVWRLPPPSLATSALLLAACVSGASSASTHGGSSVATAPLLDPGVRVFANTASDPTESGDFSGGDTFCTSKTELWHVSLAAGDKVRFAGHQVAPASNIVFEFFDPGLKDSTIGDSVDVAHGNLEDGATFTANASGSWLLAAGTHCDGADGPFYFTVTVWHKVLLFLANVGRVTHSGSISVRVRTPSGIAVTDPRLKLHLYALWRKTSFGRVQATPLSSASPRRGVARLPFHLPSAIASGSFIRFRINASGPIYLPASTTSGKLKVA